MIGDGGLIVAAPTVLVRGGRYRWERGRSPDDLQPAQLPTGLGETIPRSSPIGKRRSAGSSRAAATAKHRPIARTPDDDTALGFEDIARAMVGLPRITATEADQAAAPVAAQGVSSGSVDVPEGHFDQTEPARRSARNEEPETLDSSWLDNSRQGWAQYIMSKSDAPAGVAQLVERQLPKLNVEGSNPFTRFSPRAEER